MPIFLDHHDLSGMSAEDIAEAHRQDLAVQERYGVRFLTYWFESVQGTAFAWSMRRTPRPPIACTRKRMAAAPIT